MATLQQTLDSLVVPAAFARHDKIADPTVLADLYTWRSNTGPLLDRLDSFDVSTLAVSELAHLICVLAPLTAVAQWSSAATRSRATACLSKVTSSDELVVHILSQVVKPHFAPTPHPHLHTFTARILPRPANVQDTYIEQPWKEHPGLDESIRWCILHTKSSMYETAWPLFLPPVMSFLDDYQVPYKLLGVRLVSDMLGRAPPQLFLRTGVDTLIFNSLTNSLAHLGDQSTPDFIRVAITTALQLIDLTTPSVSPPDGISLRDTEFQDARASGRTHVLPAPQSKSLSTRFSRLSHILSSCLLSTIIMYTPTFLPPVLSSVPEPDPFADPEHADAHVLESTQGLIPERQSFNPTLIAAAQSLPPVLSALGIGETRFLKGVVPVLSEWLALPLPVIAAETECNGENGETYNVGDGHLKSFAADVTLHLAALSSLSVLFNTCTPRIGGWSTEIVNAMGRCWVGCLDTENKRQDRILSKVSLYALQKCLREAVVQLARLYPSVIKNEYAVLLASNMDLFEGLVGGIY